MLWLQGGENMKKPHRQRRKKKIKHRPLLPLSLCVSATDPNTNPQALIQAGISRCQPLRDHVCSSIWSWHTSLKHCSISHGPLSALRDPTEHLWRFSSSTGSNITSSTTIWKYEKLISRKTYTDTDLQVMFYTNRPRSDSNLYWS